MARTRAKKGRWLLLAGLAGGAVALSRARRQEIEAVAPELRHPILHLPLHITNEGVVKLLRKGGGLATPVREGITATDRTITVDGSPPVPVVVYEAPGRHRPSGALVWMHGGGMLFGSPNQDHPLCSQIADELGVLVVSVDYRLAPEDPFPAGLDDCMAVLAWLHAEAAELGVDPSRIAVGGASAGGGLAAAVAQRAHDEGSLPVAFQLLVYPMLDDRTVLRTDDRGTGSFIWTARSNRFAWTAYLGHPPLPAGDGRPYVAPARRTDLSGLPPAWIGVGDLDLFHEEDVDYATRLEAAGVPCDLLVEPGMYHAADGIRPGTALMKEFQRRAFSALDRHIGAATDADLASDGVPATS